MTKERTPFDMVKDQIHADPDRAWGWHCNLAMPIMDSIQVSAEDANKAGAALLSFLFDYDITKHPNYRWKS